MSAIGLDLEPLRSPLGRRLIVAIILVSSAITLVLTGLQLFDEYKSRLLDIEDEYLQIERVHLKSLSNSLWSANQRDLQLQLEGIARVPKLEFVAVREGGRLWAEAGQRVSDSTIERKFAMTAEYHGRTLEIGTLTVVAGLDPVYRELIDHAMVILASNAVKTFLVAGFALAFFHRMVNRHLADIARHLRGLDLNQRAAPLRLARAAAVRPDEIDEVVAATNHLQAEALAMLAALRESVAKYRALIESAASGIFLLDAQHRFLEGNPQACRMLGYTEEELRALNFLEIVVPEDRARVAADIAKTRAGKAPRSESNLCRKGGEQLMIELEASTLPEGRVLCIARDITERKRTLEQISRQRNQLSALSRRLAAERDLQSRAVARELHDRVGQNLTVLGINLTRLRGDPAASEEARARIDDSLALLEETGRVISDVLTELKPPLLASYGLPQALRWHAKQLAQRAGIAIEVTDAALPRLAADIEMALFRIAQAALNNAVQHARARGVAVHLEATENAVRLEVADDGSGFDVAAHSVPRSWGLAAMKERAAAIDGSLIIESAPGHGTRIIVEARLES